MKELVICANFSTIRELRASPELNGTTMARNHNFFFDKHGTPKARGPAAEGVLMMFLELDVQGSDHICRDLMDDVTAIEDESDDSREFIGNAHHVTIEAGGVLIAANRPDSDVPQTPDTPYHVPLKHFREVLEDWEAFILDDQIDDSIDEDEYQ